MNLPIWTPKNPDQSQMAAFMRTVAARFGILLNDYQDLYHWSIAHPKLFWVELCQFFAINFDTPPQEILTPYQHMIDARWFVGAKFNFAQKLLSRTDDTPALICLDENNNRQVLSYKELGKEVAKAAAGLKALGVGVGDRVAAVLPNTSYTIIAMLATTSLGAIFSSCSPDFGAEAITDRIAQIEPKVLLICDGHQYHGTQYPSKDKIHALNTSLPTLKSIIICPNIHEVISLHELPKALLWDDFMKPATQCQFVSLPFNHPVYIMFSSGTTGKPKCIIHGAGNTLLQHIKELGLHCDMRPKDNMLFYTTCGWMMWHWSVSTLALGATLTLYEGSPAYPQYTRLFQLIEMERVSVFGTSAKFLATIEKEKVPVHEWFDLSSLRLILSTGSPLLPNQYDFVMQNIKPDVQLSSISGGTDIISCFALGNPLCPIYKGELQSLGLGMAVEVFDDKGNSVRHTQGELVCTKPFPSMPVGFWNDPNQTAYKHAYFERFPGIWTHGDYAEITSHHGLIIYGRSDAVLNPGGVRIGTAEIYRQVLQIESIVDSIVVSQDWQGDVRIVLFVKLRAGLKLNDNLINKIKQTIRRNTSPRHVPAKILQVADIPRTLSGKIVELAVRQTIHNQPVQNIQSLANPEALAYFKERIELK
jgi:acetoacetyl-CoA synthetase